MPKNQIRKAGAVIFNPVKFDRVVLLYSSLRNDWSFPKGHIDGEETPIEAMKREVKEETGLTGRIVAQLPDLKYSTPQRENILVNMYLMVAENEDGLKPEYPGDEVQWCHKDDVTSVLTYPNLKDYFSNNLVFMDGTLRKDANG